MKVNAITSFKGNPPKIHKQDEVELKRDAVIDNFILSMVPAFLRDEADILCIATTADENDNIFMSVSIGKEIKPQESFNDKFMREHPEVVVTDVDVEGYEIWEKQSPSDLQVTDVEDYEIIESEPMVKKSLFQKIKSIFNRE